jgi:signal transduction histidine kinase
VVFRAAQESLTNVAKHAQAHRVEITVRKLRHTIRMEVIDDGRSFSPDPQNSAARGKQLGLLGMQERVRLVGGRFTVDAKPGKGTTVRVEIPFKGISEIRSSKRRPKPRAAPRLPRSRLELRARSLLK